MPSLRFTVDSALLRELGERLVGKPHIALAELVKNAYDADATKALITFSDNRIQVADNGRGMNLGDFEDFWMRIGSPHKQEQRLSRTFGRPLTGSKGIGRLSVQFLASRLELRTVASEGTDRELVADVNWQEAIAAKDLTEAQVNYRSISRQHDFPDGGQHGTMLVLHGLNHTWSKEQFRDLGRELWSLQPPFRLNSHVASDRRQSFEVELQSDKPGIVDLFDQQMRAILSIWTARIVGKIAKRDGKGKTNVLLTLEFPSGDRQNIEYSVSGGRLHEIDFEVRVFNLKNRQPHGIRVDEARSYLNNFGGIHVYDAGFHLPYYGPDTDWLRIEIDHSHRLSQSRLLPDELHVPEGLNYLPTNSRLFGVVNIDTSLERRNVAKADPRTGRQFGHLEVQVTRDRLVDNAAFQELRDAVRWAIDYYAMQEARRQLARAERARPSEPVPVKAARVGDVLAHYESEIPKEVHGVLEKELDEVLAASESEAEATARQVGLLGALATAGISALAYEHEVSKQFHLLERIRRDLERVGADGQPGQDDLAGLAGRLGGWLERARGTRDLFAHLLNERSRDEPTSLRARGVVETVLAQTRVFLRDVEVDLRGLDSGFALPTGRHADWTAILQNVLINAANAMLDSEHKRLRVASGARGKRRHLLVEDTGVGVELDSSEELFEPFVRRLKVSDERRALGFGGMGLGLTIVRMLATNLECRVAFVEPRQGYSTTFRISWRLP